MSKVAFLASNCDGHTIFHYHVPFDACFHFETHKICIILKLVLYEFASPPHQSSGISALAFHAWTSPVRLGHDRFQCICECDVRRNSMALCAVARVGEIQFCKHVSVTGLNANPSGGAAIHQHQTMQSVEKNCRRMRMRTFWQRWKVEDQKQHRRGKTLWPNIKFHLFHPKNATCHTFPNHPPCRRRQNVSLCYPNEAWKSIQQWNSLTKYRKFECGLSAFMHQQRTDTYPLTHTHTRSSTRNAQKSETLTATKTIGLVVDVALQR